jgi:hypothetical protein
MSPILFLTTNPNRDNMRTALARDLRGAEVLLFSTFVEWVKYFLSERRTNSQVISVIDMATLDDSDKNILADLLNAEHCDARIIFIVHSYEDEAFAHTLMPEPLFLPTLSARGLATKTATV